MEFSVSVGESDFDSLRKSGSFYVDKTDILYELIENAKNKVTLFTRPRRFGKTLMMSMMSNFFSIRKDSREIFTGLKIMEHKQFCEKWMNQYPVLFVSFKDIEALDFKDALDMLRYRLSDVCMDHKELFEYDQFNEEDKEVFRKLLTKNGSISDVKNGLKAIMRMLHAVYGKKVILLIDEYDVPLAKASERNTEENRFYASMLDVIRGIMSMALKDNEFLELAVITGCLRIAKESIFTGTNNFASYSVLDKRFSRYFGFVQDEIDEMLKAAEREEAAETMKEWYDGYVFGSSYVYCPWDVINYISSLRYERTAKPKNYWKNTSHNGILVTFVERTDFDVSGKFETLMNGGTVTQTISDELTYDTLHLSEDNLWSVLLMTGYVTKSDAKEEGEAVSLKIPNKEILTIFEDAVVRFFRDSLDTAALNPLMDALWGGDVEDVGTLISELLWTTISYNDYHEDYYHAFLAGLFVGRGYQVDSNKEKGLGRPDILLKDKKNRRAIIIEAKKSREETDLDRDCEAALAQIAGKKYAEGLYGYKQILCYGVAFFQKQAKVKKLK